MNLVAPVFGFDDTALRVIGVAWWALVLLILALLAGAIQNFCFLVDEAEKLVVEAMLGMSRREAEAFYVLYRSCRPKNPAIAWFLAVGLGPLGAFAYLGRWGAAGAALVTLNGFGAWWIESWYSIPRLVLIENRRHVAHSLDQLAFTMKLDEVRDARA